MHRCCSLRLARSGTRRLPPATVSPRSAPARGAARPLSTKSGEAAGTKAPQAPPPRSDSTLLFRATNPELQLDASKPRNWIWPAGVVLFFAAYYAYLYSVGDFLPAEPPSKLSHLPDGVLKVGRGNCTCGQSTASSRQLTRPSPRTCRRCSPTAAFCMRMGAFEALRSRPNNSGAVRMAALTFSCTAFSYHTT
eukprot:scaffold18905_cov129-Isochrysis_galbana.AAC.1